MRTVGVVVVGSKEPSYLSTATASKIPLRHKAFVKVIQMFELLCFFLLLVLNLSTGGVGGFLVVHKVDGSDGSLTGEKCNFPAVFSFGDSNWDTGAISAAYGQMPPPPIEQTISGKPSGRFCDGRLIIDYIAMELGLPYLRAYLDPLGPGTFNNGANFGTGGSSVEKRGYSVFDLSVQVSQFRQFKSRIIGSYNYTDQQQGEVNLPKPEDFSEALYTFDIGQNDISFGLQQTSERETRASIPRILNKFSEVLQQLYNDGARVFWVHNTGPVGCLPYSSIYYPKKSGNLDKNGCVIPMNEIAQEFNKQLKSKLVDAYSAKYNLINSAESKGFVDPLDFCCGSYYGIHVGCGEMVTVNGTVYGKPCANPEAHISWDGIHYSEAANHWIAKYIINGSMSDSSIPINQACHAL
ncbi:hypothetical protein C5167_017774 [Papaver somniferum]|uniref:Uncharacterized protein n=1 Tax=Papaver somniferum TaxID=3469 RepID=A0A4Y7IMK4_PAPSO|nr:hypothetical protein C5167_017774 [Papaver somniferum]